MDQLLKLLIENGLLAAVRGIDAGTIESKGMRKTVARCQADLAAIESELRLYKVRTGQ